MLDRVVEAFDYLRRVSCDRVERAPPHVIGFGGAHLVQGVGERIREGFGHLPGGLAVLLGLDAESGRRPVPVSAEHLAELPPAADADGDFP